MENEKKKKLKLVLTKIDVHQTNTRKFLNRRIHFQQQILIY
jgi:hypothetical protein